MKRVLFKCIFIHTQYICIHMLMLTSIRNALWFQEISSYFLIQTTVAFTG